MERKAVDQLRTLSVVIIKILQEVNYHIQVVMKKKKLTIYQTIFHLLLAWSQNPVPPSEGKKESKMNSLKKNKNQRKEVESA